MGNPNEESPKTRRRRRAGELMGSDEQAPAMSFMIPPYGYQYAGQMYGNSVVNNNSHPRPYMYFPEYDNAAMSIPGYGHNNGYTWQSQRNGYEF